MRTQSWRRHQKQRIIQKRLRMLRQHGWAFDNGPQYVPFHETFYAKKLRLRNALGNLPPLGCQKPRCSICHYEKFWQGKARRDKNRKAIEFDLKSVA